MTAYAARRLFFYICNQKGETSEQKLPDSDEAYIKFKEQLLAAEKGDPKKIITESEQNDIKRILKEAKYEANK